MKTSWYTWLSVAICSCFLLLMTACADHDLAGAELDSKPGVGGSAGSDGGVGGSAGAGDCDDGFKQTCEDCPGGVEGEQTCDDGKWSDCECPSWPDDDGDGYGDDSADPVYGDAPNGNSDKPGDCDDSHPGINPDAAEVCDDVDNDCDGQVDEGLNCGVCDPGANRSCECPNGQYDGVQYCDENGEWSVCTNCPTTDCNPGAHRACDCPNGGQGQQWCKADGTWDACLSCPATNRYYHDKDGDGYGDPADFVDTTTNPGSGWLATDGDCDDYDPNRHPGAQEVCGNGVDDNCDGNIDEGCATYTFYRDADGDGYTTNFTMPSSTPNPPAGWKSSKSQKLDCNDNNPAVHPDAVEVCDNLDNDCDNAIDEGGVCGNCTPGTQQSCACTNGGSGTQYCDATGNWSVCQGCPACTTEVCDGIDNDCDGQIDEGVKNACGGCGAVPTEVCDGVDNDCDGLVDEGVCGVCTPGDSESCVCPDNTTGTRFCDQNSQWGACGGCGYPNDTVTVKLTYTGSPWSEFPLEIWAWWNGKDTGTLPNCHVSNGTSIACTFEAPSGATNFKFQVDLGNDRYWGDTSGLYPAPCVPASELASYHGTCVEVARSGRSMGKVCLEIEGNPVEFSLRSNGIDDPNDNGTYCGASSTPYMNGYLAELPY